MEVEPRSEVQRQNQQHREDREVDAHRERPIERVAVLVRGSMLEHRFFKDVALRAALRRQDVNRGFRCRRCPFQGQNVLVLHGAPLLL